MEFEWDATKAALNERKHGISFEFAARIFSDPMRIEHTDPNEEEERWATIGLVDGIEIFLAYALREETIRLITARRATQYEREEYWDREI